MAACAAQTKAPLASSARLANARPLASKKIAVSHTLRCYTTSNLKHFYLFFACKDPLAHFSSLFYSIYR